MILKIHVIEISQPIGTFYIGKLSSKILPKIAKSSSRSSGEGIQRELKLSRAKEISKYCADPDATFPTPIILAMNTSDLANEAFFEMESAGITELKFKEHLKHFAEVLDGQHRLAGINEAEGFECDIPVAIMFDLTEEEKAYIFSTINSNQEKVDKSLIYELFDLSTHRSPYKTCHHIARIMNSDKDSPFFERLKMLGKAKKKSETLSQGTFVNYLCKQISKNPKEDAIDIKNAELLKENNSLVLRKYFIDDKDEVILRIITNYFKAVSNVFPKEWNSPRYILSKTTGYGGLLKAFPKIYELGIQNDTLSLKFFTEIFQEVKSEFKYKGIDLTSRTIALGEKGQNDLSREIKVAIKTIL